MCSQLALKRKFSILPVIFATDKSKLFLSLIVPKKKHLTRLKFFQHLNLETVTNFFSWLSTIIITGIVKKQINEKSFSLALRTPPPC